MNQPIPGEATPSCGGDAPASAEHPSGVLAKLRLRSAENPILAMVVLSTTVCLAGWGALSILYQVACWCFGPANAGAIIAGTMMCIYIAGMVLLVWWCGGRVARFFGRKRVDVPAAPPHPRLPFWKDGMTLVVVLVFLGPLIKTIMPPMLARLFPHPRPQTPILGPINTSVPTPKVLSPQESAKRWSQQRQATLAYWKTAVADLHLIRFQTPTGDEAAGSYADELFQRLRLLVNAAKSASTASVDPGLIDLTRRHLAVEDLALQLKGDVEELMKREKTPTDTVAIGQRIAEWRNIIVRIQADPSLLDDLPAGPERTLLEKALQLELERLDQLREIEIMQAVLQERYSGTTFALPEVTQ